MVAVKIETPLFSSIKSLSADIPVILGLSSLVRYSVISLIVVVAFSSVPKETTIVSLISTSVSSRPFVEITIEANDWPAVIIKGLSEIVYSVSLVAVPDKANGIETFFPETFESVALRVTSVDEFSSISGELSSKVTVGGLSPSTKVIEIASVFVLVAFTVDWGVKTIVSSSSSELSVNVVITIVPVVFPASIVISGEICFLWTLLFPLSAV